MKWVVYGEITLGVRTVVEASSHGEAVRIARDRGTASNVDVHNAESGGGSTDALECEEWVATEDMSDCDPMCVWATRGEVES